MSTPEQPTPELAPEYHQWEAQQRQTAASRARLKAEQEALPPERKAADARMEAIGLALSDATRWRILLELGRGDALPVAELAKRTSRRAPAISRHLKQLLGAGLVERAFTTCFRLPKAMRAGPGEKTIDLGPCVLKLDTLG